MSPYSTPGIMMCAMDLAKIRADIVERKLQYFHIVYSNSNYYHNKLISSGEVIMYKGL